ncbi:TIGR00730 family Rossman fold protein [Candidatus Woesearchaeota archaeon]|nr:TIGR00730 family Rossman fold protein [Candidatus Woesearchaeota archaeon]
MAAKKTITTKAKVKKTRTPKSRLKKNLKFLKKNVESKVKSELHKGLKLLNSIDNKIVSVLGSHISPPSSKEYKHCMKLAEELGKRGYGIVTGGGPGVMDAANRGAKKVGAPSVGIKAGMIKNEKVNSTNFSHVDSFDFLFVRRFLLAIKSEALIFYPGGFGTLNELYEYIVLIETGMVDEVPLVLVDSKFWNGMIDWLEESPLKRHLITHMKKDMKLLTVADKVEDIVKAIDG